MKTAPSGTATDIKRFYLGVDHKFNNVYSANVTTDFQYNSTLSATELFIKKAYVQAKYSDALTVRIGSADLPWVPFVEDTYGYRYLEQVVVDRDKFGTSADWGVHVLGKFGMDGMFAYQVSAVNGSGYKVAPGTGSAPRTNAIDLEGRLSGTFAKHLVVAVGGYTGKLGNDKVGSPATLHTANRFDTLIAWTDPKWRVGAEYFTATDWKNVTTVASDKTGGYSVFGSYKLNDTTAVFARVDSVTPSKTVAPSTKETYYNLGVSYSPAKIVDFSLAYKYDKVEKGTLSTGNGTIGGSTDGAYSEIGLFGQFRF